MLFSVLEGMLLLLSCLRGDSDTLEQDNYSNRMVSWFLFSLRMLKNI